MTYPSVDYRGGDAPRPYCGRIDAHDKHAWSTGARRRRGEPELECPGPPVIEGGHTRGKDFEQRA